MQLLVAGGDRGRVTELRERATPEEVAFFKQPRRHLAAQPAS